MLHALEQIKDGLHVVEGVHGTWYYHLRKNGERTALCGYRVMQTSIPVSAWGVTNSHIGERWCSRCAKIAANLKSQSA